MNVALIGPAAVGKSTCAALLGEVAGMSKVAPGDLLRSHREQQTALGILAAKYLDHGELVPDEIVNAMIAEAVRKLAPAAGLVFDGFPRTAYQARFLDGTLKDSGQKLDLVIYLHAPEPVLVERSARRRPRRDDDRPDILHRRLRVFQRATGPVLKYYADSNRLAFLRAEAGIDPVITAIREELGRIATGTLRPVAPADWEEVRAMFAPPAIPPAVAARPSLNLVLVGGPGSGKGTQADLLSAELQLPHISAGELFRQNVQQQTDLGRLARYYLDQGELVPDDLTEAMMSERLASPDAARGFVLDGFPRTLAQAEALNEMLAESQRRLDGVVYLYVPDDDLVARLSERRVCPRCQATYHLQYHRPRKSGLCDHDGSLLEQREDDCPETVRARLHSFRFETEPLITHYQRAGLLIVVVGTGKVAQVHQGLMAAIHLLQRSK